MHISTEQECDLLDKSLPVANKRISAETCIYYLIFDDKDYEKYGHLIKCNPAIKTKADRQALLKAVIDDRIDIISTDHAPHSFEDKQKKYSDAPSGIPGVQHSLVAMLELYHQGLISLEKLVEKMCHNPALCYNVAQRGFIRKGYFADLAIIDLNSPWTVDKSNILYKCKWSPFENQTFKSKVTHTFVNGHLSYNNGNFDESIKGRKILFNR
jgi:dihydroorotase